MEVLLAKVTQQAMTYAIRSGIAITSTYAIKQCGRLTKSVEDESDKQELASLQMRLDSKIRIVSPAIDMIELISARGNTTLESAVSLTKSLRWDIQTLGSRVESAVAEEQLFRRGSSRARSRAQNEMELKHIISEMRQLLARIEDAVPLINLAIATSGVSLHTTLPTRVSPSRLLQASTFLTAGDMNYCATKPRIQQIGPTFTLSMYMLFSGYSNRTHVESFRDTTWKEVMHKARVTLLRVPLDHVYDYPVSFGETSQRNIDGSHRHIPSDNVMQEFAYQLLIVEDLDDGRMHDYEDGDPKPGAYDGINEAGVREVVPIHEISKIFYADTGKILNIGTDGESNNPILLLKRDINAAPPRRMMDQDTVETGYESEDSHTAENEVADPHQTELEEQLHRESTTTNIVDSTAPPQLQHPTFPWRLPPTLDLEWIALEVFAEDIDAESENDDLNEEHEVSSPPPTKPSTNSNTAKSPTLVSRLSNINLRPSTPSNLLSATTANNQLIPSPQKAPAIVPQTYQPPISLPPIKTSLSLLEMLIRLTALQQFQQSSHLAIPDEFLNFFLSDSSTVGAGSDAELRRHARREACMRVGFDPYDESPIKRRGEEYLEHELHHSERDYASGTPPDGTLYDYEGYPGGRVSSRYSRSRSATPDQSPSLPHSTPMTGQHSKSSVNTSVAGELLGNITSPSPLLRRATTQTNHYKGLKQPSFRGPPTVLHPLNSPR